MAALLGRVLLFCAYADAALIEGGSACSTDTSKTESPSLLQMPSATFSKHMAEKMEEEEEEEVEDATIMRSDDQDMTSNWQGRTQIASNLLTCSQEEAIRKKIVNDMKVKTSRSARIIRAVFHDAIDEGNLLMQNSTTGKWEPVQGTYGGVDDCLYSLLSRGDKGIPEPNHNKNLGGISVAYMKLCSQLCASRAYASTTLCVDKSNCEVDLRVLGALVTIENAGGPRIPMTWGRKKGDCSKMVVSKGAVKRPALRFAPSLTGLDDADSFRTAFDRLGFSAKEQAALMGAHSFGKLAVCAGGLNGIEKGNWCNDPTKLDPPLKQSNFAPWSRPEGPCKPIYGKVGGGVSNGCWARTSNGELAPVFAFKKGGTFVNGTAKGFGRGLGDGGFFDRTPDTFDNDYYKLFAGSSFDGKDVCCGKMKKGECDRAKGSPERITKRNAAGRGIQSKKVPGGECAVSWCRDDRKEKTHMKSTRAWAEAPHDFVKKGYKFGVTKRMIRLAGDWALLGNNSTRASVELFAKDQSAFFEAFKIAFTKVINKGYTDLVSCLDGRGDSDSSGSDSADSDAGGGGGTGKPKKGKKGKKGGKNRR